MPAVRFLITGMAGFAGRHLRSLLLQNGDIVFGLVRRLPPDLAGWGIAAESLAIADMLDPVAVRDAVRASRPDGVFHLAAQSSVGGGEEEASATVAVNTLGTLHLLEAVRREAPGCRLLVVSSGESYGASASAAPVAEEAPLRPRSIYGASKACAEILVQQAVDAGGVDVVRARPFNHTGPGQSARFVCADFARQVAAIERGEATGIRVGNLEAVRDFLDVRDVVRAYAQLWQQGEPGGVYNICSGVGRRIGDVLEDLRHRARAPVAVEVEAQRVRPLEQAVLVGDSSRLRALGWAAEYSWEQTLDDVLADWRARPDAP